MDSFLRDDLVSLFRDTWLSPIKSWSDMTLREIKKHAANNEITDYVDGDKRCRESWIVALESFDVEPEIDVDRLKSAVSFVEKCAVFFIEDEEIVVTGSELLAPGSQVKTMLEISLLRKKRFYACRRARANYRRWLRSSWHVGARVIQRAWRAKKEEEEEKKKIQIALEAVKKLDYDILFTNLCDWDYIGNDEFKLDISDKAGNFHRYNYYENEGKTVWRRGPRNAKGVCGAKPVGAWVGNE